MLKTNVFLCFSLTIFCFSIASAQRNVGDRCSIQAKNNAPGECKVLRDCPDAIEDLKKQIFPQTCGFQGTMPIVCCAKVTTPTRVRKPGEISFEKCKKYTEVVTQEIDLPVFSIDEDAATVTESTCTHEVGTLVIGGVDAEAKEFPHMALLGYQLGNGPRKWLCGGALISEKFVLTAGHCLTSPGDGDVRFVRVGDLDISRTDDDAQPQDFLVTERIKHPGYKLPSKYNDIALLKLNRAVQFNHYARPACLYTEKSRPLKADQRFIATGWGLTEVGSSVGATHLQKVILDAFSQTECNSSYESNINRRLKDGIRPDSQLCAGGKTEEKDTCQGDSGGPLQIYSTLNCMYDIVGVTSFGKSCGLVSVPGVYTRVSNYLEWIEKTVWP